MLQLKNTSKPCSWLSIDEDLWRHFTGVMPDHIKYYEDWHKTLIPEILKGTDWLTLRKQYCNKPALLEVINYLEVCYVVV